MDSEELTFETGRTPFTDLTPAARRFCGERNGDGLLSVFVPHATAGIALFELGAGSDEDLAEVIGRLVPRDFGWRHRHGSFGHGADHVLPAIVSPSVVIPVISGEPALGIWQSIVLIDTNHDNPRRTVRLSFLG